MFHHSQIASVAGSAVADRVCGVKPEKAAQIELPKQDPIIDQIAALAAQVAALQATIAKLAPEPEPTPEPEPEWHEPPTIDKDGFRIWTRDALRYVTASVLHGVWSVALHIGPANAGIYTGPAQGAVDVVRLLIKRD